MPTQQELEEMSRQMATQQVPEQERLVAEFTAKADALLAQIKREEAKLHVIHSPVTLTLGEEQRALLRRLISADSGDAERAIMEVCIRPFIEILKQEARRLAAEGKL